MGVLGVKMGVLGVKMTVFELQWGGCYENSGFGG
jgi:hypothetical protein